MKSTAFLLSIGNLALPYVQAQIPQAAFDYVTSSGLVSLKSLRSISEGGNATLTILKDSDNVQDSIYGGNSFRLENTGSKRIAAVFIDVTNSMFRDIVFDDDGSGGDNMVKKLSYDSGQSETGAVPIDDYEWQYSPARDTSFDASASFRPMDLDDVNSLFVDDVAETASKAGGGFRGELLVFTDFDPGEAVEFSGDMDPNSLAGLAKETVDSGANWDTSGVSGAEMVNGLVSVFFEDQTTVVGTIAADGSQAGSIAVISDSLVDPPTLIVNGLTGGGSGNYTSTRPLVTVSSSPGNAVRISMAKGFNPVVNSKLLANGQITVDTLVQARLDAQYPEFPVSNAKHWQHFDIQIPSSGFFDVSDAFDYDENLAVGFIAVVVDSNGLPASMTTNPILLRYAGKPTAAQTAPPTTQPSLSPVVNPVSGSPTVKPISNIPTVAPTPRPTTQPSFSLLASTVSTLQTASPSLTIRPPTAPVPAYSYAWIGFLQGLGQLSCADTSNALVGGFACQGGYCDNVLLRCSKGGTFYSVSESYWTPAISEETDPVFCEEDYFMTGVSCSGLYCDDVALQCTKSEGRTSSENCKWSDWVSEEGLGQVLFTDTTTYFARGMKCKGHYCDDKSFWICGAFHNNS